MKKMALSVDWDYFTPSAKIFWDNIEENKYNLINAWRYRVVDSKVKIEDIYTNFWKWLSKWFVIPKDEITILVSESHLALYNLLKSNHKLILFDSHHDCYYNSYLDCGSWGTNWLEQNKDAKITWFSQFESQDLSILKNLIKREIKSQISVIDKEHTVSTLNDMYLEKGKRSHFDFIHICRSGCWTPPNFDANFVKFLESSNCKIEVISDFMKVNPLESRFEELFKTNQL
ncbi:MAG: hypothetical protein WC516_05155 [Patescibacteria group bacterium]|jgi:hypothetical protein